MSSLVSDFIINPVARTVRRFSTPFASSNPEPVRRYSQDWENEDAVAEFDGSSLSFPALSFARSPDIALGATSPPLLIPQRRRTAPPPDSHASRPSTASPASNHLFVMEHPDISEIELPPVDTQLPQLDDPLPTDQDVAKMSRKLPANDGMFDMRRRIQVIQSSSITYDQKRYLMQQVLTENYTNLRHAKAVADGKIESPVPRNELPLADVPLASASRDFGFGATALETLKSWTGLEEKVVIEASAQDAQPTYVPWPPAALEIDDLEDSASDEEIEPQLGCQHYKRNVRIQCADCSKWYTCRLCHDAEEDHTLPRRLTKHMLCMLCGHPQKVSDTCVNCGESAAQYYCGICKLWSDDVNKPIYHCDECGICRVGHGLDKDFFHCKTCRACIAISTNNDHKCIESATDADCPICGENMFSSPQTVIFMECGHPIHRSCFTQYMTTSYKCPLCNKSIVKMDALFMNLANIIKEQPMPEEFQNVRSVILCNDCSAKCSTAYHFLGLRCEVCQSYNTVELDRSPMPGYTSENEQEPNQEAPSQTQDSSAVENGQEAISTAARVPHTPAATRLLYGDTTRAASSRSLRFAEPEVNIPDEDEETEEEVFDFWGREVRSDPSGSEEEDEEGESSDGVEESEIDEDEDEDEEDDDNEDEYDIVLLGHR